jgi:hypothetical protein
VNVYPTHNIRFMALGRCAIGEISPLLRRRSL